MLPDLTFEKAALRELLDHVGQRQLLPGLASIPKVAIYRFGG
jgi:hypothetical protein